MKLKKDAQTKVEKLRTRASRIRGVPALSAQVQRRTVSQTEETLFFVASEIIEALADALEE